MIKKAISTRSKAAKEKINGVRSDWNIQKRWCHCRERLPERRSAQKLSNNESVQMGNAMLVRG